MDQQDRTYRAKQAELFMALVDKVIVDDGLTFVLRDGTEQKDVGVR